MAAECLSELLRAALQFAAKAAKKITKIVLKTSGSVLEIGANVCSAVASENPNSALSILPDVINFLSY